MKRVCLLLFLLILLFADGGEADEVEMRGLWVVRNTLTSRSTIAEAVHLAQQGNFNTLFVQVCGRGDAYYKSAILPPAEGLMNQQDDFDPLAVMIQEAHQAGLQVHAWVNVFYVWSAENAPRSPQHIYHANPEWAMVDRDGRSIRDYTMQERKQARVEGVFISPGDPRVRQFLRSVVDEIVSNYDIDGLHLDYVRYPGVGYSFDRITRTRFEIEAGVDPFALINNHLQWENTESFLAKIDEWTSWRAEQITRLVRGLYYDIQRQKPQVQFSAAVIADLERAYFHLGQKWADWLTEEIIDFVVPMAYTSDMNRFAQYIEDAKNVTGERQVYMGIGVWNQPFENALQQLDLCRREGIRGVVLFSHNAMLDYPQRFAMLQAGVFEQQARIPQMKSKDVPELVINDTLKVKKGRPKWTIPPLILD